MAMTRRDVQDLYSSMRDAQSYIHSRRDSGGMKKDMPKALFRTAKVGAGSALVGYLAGRMGTASVGPGAGVPLGLVAGFGGHLLSFFDILPSWLSPHVADVSDGAIAGWTTMWGAGQGTSARQAAGKPVGPIAAGLLPPGPAGPPQQMHHHSPQQLGAGGVRRSMTEAELEAMSYHYPVR